MAEVPEGSVAIEDRVFLMDYVEFGVWYPGWVARSLMSAARTETDEMRLRALGVEIFRNAYMQLEVLVQWFYALEKWEPNRRSLLGTLKGIKVIEESKCSTEDALRRVGQMSPDELIAALKVPSEEQMRERGQREDAGEISKRGFHGLVEWLPSALGARGLYEGAMVRAYNGVKHGATIMGFNFVREESAPSVALIGRVSAQAQGKVSAEFWELACGLEMLEGLVSVTRRGCVFLAGVLGVVAWYHFTQSDWQQYAAWWVSSLTQNAARMFEGWDEFLGILGMERT